MFLISPPKQKCPQSWKINYFNAPEASNALNYAQLLSCGEFQEKLSWGEFQEKLWERCRGLSGNFPDFLPESSKPKPTPPQHQHTPNTAQTQPQTQIQPNQNPNQPQHTPIQPNHKPNPKPKPTSPFLAPSPRNKAHNHWIGAPNWGVKKSMLKILVCLLVMSLTKWFSPVAWMKGFGGLSGSYNTYTCLALWKCLRGCPTTSWILEKLSPSPTVPQGHNDGVTTSENSPGPPQSPAETPQNPRRDPCRGPWEPFERHFFLGEFVEGCGPSDGDPLEL